MKFIKYFLNKTYKPLLEKYLAKPRKYRYKGNTFLIEPGVFHPGFFFSTKFLLNFLMSFPLKSKTLLELGAGSGFISLHASRAGAHVTASDISLQAFHTIRVNSELQSEKIQIIHSDLFMSIPRQDFDFIVINPPYYKKDPIAEAEYAWYCGKNGEYFTRLFAVLSSYMHKDSIVLMVLSEDCDIEMINSAALKNSFLLNKLKEKRILWENNFIYQICFDDDYISQSSKKT